jgi:hypothetical protein
VIRHEVGAAEEDTSLPQDSQRGSFFGVGGPDASTGGEGASGAAAVGEGEQENDSSFGAAAASSNITASVLSVFPEDASGWLIWAAVLLLIAVIVYVLWCLRRGRRNSSSG